MPLRAVQKQFLDFLYQPKLIESSVLEMDSLVIDGKSKAQSGLKIYRKNLIFNFVSALKETYPFCSAFLGEKNFNFLAKEYVFQNPSKSSDMIEYGEYFSAFLKSRSEIASHFFLVDMAQLEWTRERAYYQKPDKPITLEHVKALMEQEPDQIFLSLRQPLYLIQTEFPIHQAYQAFQNGDFSLIYPETFQLKPEKWVVWNGDGAALSAKIGQKTWDFLRDLQQNKSLGSVLAGSFGGDSNAFDREIKFIFSNGWIGIKY